MTQNSLKILSAKGDSLIVGNYLLSQRPSRPPTHAPHTPVVLSGGAVLGTIDWTSAKADSAGLWIARILDRRNRYVKMLEEALAAGLVTTAPIFQSGKAGGDVTLVRDVLIPPQDAQKAFDFETAVLRRALGLDFNPRLAALRLKQKSNEAALLALEMRLKCC